MEGQDNINVDSPGEEEMDSHPEPSPTLEEFRKSRGFRRRMSESAREIPSEGLSRLARLGNGIRRRLSGSTRDVSTTGTTAAEMAAEGKSGGNGLRRHLSASMKDLLLNGDAEGLGRRLSRRLSLLAGTVASRADNTRGSLRARLPNLRRSRTFTVTLVLPDSSHRTVSVALLSILVLTYNFASNRIGSLLFLRGKHHVISTQKNMLSNVIIFSSVH
nr:uncharacterized protein LOC128689036 [Cherax quadricarinatus]